jgi:hypothetical protein
MISRKMKLLSAVVGAGALFASAAIAYTIHKGAALAAQVYQAYRANDVVGPDGKLIGTASNPTIRSQMQLDGLPE